jgi:hypothetical protein
MEEDGGYRCPSRMTGNILGRAVQEVHSAGNRETRRVVWQALPSLENGNVRDRLGTGNYKKGQKWENIVIAGRRGRGEMGWHWPCVESGHRELWCWDRAECVSAWEVDYQEC